MAASSEKPAKNPGNQGGEKGATSDAEVEQLADKVYRLMMQDVRLEHARGSGGGS